MIAVAGLMMARAASSSLRQATEAIKREREMRNRWAMTSLARYCLNEADLPPPSQSTNPPSDLRLDRWRTIRLAEADWRVLVSEESGKLPLPRLAQRFEPAIVSALVDEVSETRIRPDALQTSQARGGAMSSRWENWLIGNDRTPGESFALPESTRRVTLYGLGRVNIRHASTRTVNVLWQQLLGYLPPPELHLIRTGRTKTTIDSIVASLALRESQARLIREWFSTDNECRSVWVVPSNHPTVRPTQFIRFGPVTSSDFKAFSY